MEEIQGLTDLQLQEADEEKERILVQLQELEKKVRKTRKVRHRCSYCPGLPQQSGQLRRGANHSCLWLHCWPSGEPDLRETWMHVIKSGA